ncbi:ricin-type beta-trefoil lectin domain protein [Actinokineospora sp. HUAS TT18]|uniref:RICIN domain-containing protein n=1 Tax=Actinokineospora sp. HUAS TT18 TaxID=3447451 RepID=UPI003F51DD35
MILTAVGAAFTATTPVTASAAPVTGLYFTSGLSPNRQLDADPATISTNGGRAYQYEFNGGYQQRWILYSDGSISPEGDQTMCLDANPNTNWDGGQVYLWKCNGAMWQKWWWNYGTPYGRRIENRHSWRCLDVNPNTNWNMGTVYMWGCNDAPQQSWILWN